MLSSSVSATSHFAHRVKEPDQMMMRGNWEGVVLVAVQFKGGVEHWDEDMMGLESMSMSMSVSMRTEGLIKTAEVEQLVRRVVPDEVGECVISACCFCVLPLGYLSY